MNFCSQCGTKLEVSWNVCPNCGHNLKSERVSPQPTQIQIPVQTYPQKQNPPQPVVYPHRNNNTNGIIALIFGLLGLFNVIPVIGSILGIVFGAIGRKKDDNRGMAIAGLVLGIIGIVIWITLYLIIFISFFRSFSYYPYMD
jgi:hypothetical protein